MQDVEAEIHKAKLESEGRLAAMRKDLLAAEDRERAELELEYRQVSDPSITVRNRVVGVQALTFGQSISSKKKATLMKGS